MASCTWAYIDPDAHTTTTHRLARLHSRHPNLIPFRGYSRVGHPPTYGRMTITPAVFPHVFPTGVGLIMTNPLMLAQHSHKHTGDKDNRPTPLSHKSVTSSGTSPQAKGAGSGLSGTPL